MFNTVLWAILLTTTSHCLYGDEGLQYTLSDHVEIVTDSLESRPAQVDCRLSDYNNLSDCNKIDVDSLSSCKKDNGVPCIAAGKNTKELTEQTAPDNALKFKPTQLILPSALIATGIFGVYHNGFIKLNNTVQDGLVELRKSHYAHIDDYIQYLPALTYATLGLLRVPCRLSFKERVAVEATSYLAMAAIVNIGKYSFREKRPDSNARNSFPSGHSATVFTGAELMRIEYGTAIGMASYAVAISVAFLRLYNGRHWVNDVLAGAGVGILCARIGYWMLPLYRKWFKWNDSPSGVSASVVPSYSVKDRNIALNLCLCL